MAKKENRGGQYRKLLLEQRGQTPAEEEPKESAFFRIRFYISLCLFAAFAVLDFTKTSVKGVDSSRICAEIARDISGELKLQEAWSAALDSVFHSEESNTPQK